MIPLLLCLVAALLWPLETATACPNVIGNCYVMQPGDEWNRRIDNDPVDYMSPCYVTQALTSRNIRLDFGSTELEYGIPYSLVPGNQPRVPIRYYDPELADNPCCEDGSCGVCTCDLFGNCNDQCCNGDYSDESDQGDFPFPQDARIEGGNNANPDPNSGDRHIIAVDTDNCVIYETFSTVRLANGFMCSSSARFDMTIKNYNRLSEFPGSNSVTSADAAGLPIFPGLLRYEEASTGSINHAIRFTVSTAQRAYRFPGTHFGTSSNVNNIPYGTRFRLKASFNETPYLGNTAALAIVRALKKYGMIFADQGSPIYLSGVSHPSWASTISLINNAARIPGDQFEAVQSPYPIVYRNTPSPNPPVC